MPARHVLTIEDLGRENLAHLVESSVRYASGAAAGEKPLAGRIVGIYFRRSSTRTRSSFTAGALKLGAQAIAYGPDDLQLVTGETLEDTARVLAGYLDALVVRTNDSLEELRTLAGQDEMPVVNALTRNQHPTQAIADLSTLQERFGRLDTVHLLYLGEGNSTAAALALATALTPGMRITLVCPEGYGLPEEVLEQAAGLAGTDRGRIEQHSDMGRLPRPVDAVYTSRWQTMGVSKEEEGWQERFRPYRVTAEVMARVSRPSGTVFLHDLPAVRGEDVTDEVLDGPQSLAWRQSRHKMFSAMAILDWCVNG